MLRRGSSLVVADIPVSPIAPDSMKTGGAGMGMGAAAAKQQPTVFEEPDASALLDSFGF